MLGGIYKGRPVTLGYVKIIDLHQGTDSQAIAMGMHLLAGCCLHFGAIAKQPGLLEPHTSS
jgi:hypothetical protein